MRQLKLFDTNAMNALRAARVDSSNVSTTKKMMSLTEVEVACALCKNSLYTLVDISISPCLELVCHSFCNRSDFLLQIKIEIKKLEKKSFVFFRLTNETIFFIWLMFVGTMHSV